ncbi:MAG: hypothetical protein ACRDBQ_23255 [Shewanella sp.]
MQWNCLGLLASACVFYGICGANIATWLMISMASGVSIVMMILGLVKGNHGFSLWTLLCWLMYLPFCTYLLFVAGFVLLALVMAVLAIMLAIPHLMENPYEVAK